MVKLMQTQISLGQSYGEFLGEFPWEWYGTLTFRDKVSPRMAFKLFNKWKVMLKKATGHRIEYVLAIEPTPSRNATPHLHFLLLGVGDEKEYEWEQQWYILGGLAKIQRYNPELSASYYLGHKLVSGTVDVVFSKGLGDIALVAP
jgi:hypothetical protein